MKILGIDTSTESLGVALIEDGNLLLSSETVLGMRHSRDLIPTIKEMLNKASLAIGDVNGFAVGLGPGSFTGLRIGVTAAKTLSLISGKPVVGVPTLDVIACNGYYYPGAICPIMDARKRLVYAAIYDRGRAGLKRRSGYLLLPVEELLKKVKKKTLFLGDGVNLYGNTIKKIKRAKAEFAPCRLWLPRPDNVAMLGWNRLKRGRKDDTLRMVPMYLHSKECNIRI